MSPVLQLRNISKRFGSVVALDTVSFELARGEVHGLLGENGAGKSTLMHVAFGMISPDAGEVLVQDTPVRFRTPRDAKQAGVGMVHQHFTSVPELTVAENLWLAAGRFGHPVGRPDGSTGTGVAGRLRARLWEGLSPAARVADLPVGAKQRLEILQALATGAEILLLDEPTAVLAPPETAELLALLREYAAAGGAVVLITHKLTEVFSAVDRVTVMRGGRVQLTGPLIDQTMPGLTAAMVGRSDLVPTSSDAGAVGPVLVRVDDLTVRGGEIVGIVAVEGNGQRELLRRLAGVAPRDGAEVTGPVAFIPEDRTTEGLIPAFSLTENLVLGLAGDPRWRRGALLDWRTAAARMGELVDEFSIRAPGPEAAARTLSGGNQQKVVFARALEAKPRVIVAENPTRGLDVQATWFVHERFRRAALDGAAVVVYSTDLDEVLTIATRVVVVSRGRLRSVLPGTTREAIGAMMIGASS